MYTQAQKWWIWLSQLPGIDSGQFYRLLEVYGQPELAFAQPEKAREVLKPRAFASLCAPDRERAMEALFADMEKGGIEALTHLHDHYPQGLRFIPDPPPTLFLRGAADRWTGHAVGIVGSRNATRDGLRTAFEIARDLSQNNVTVISGLARGIDTAAHEGAIAGGGRTAAVLGCGLNAVQQFDSAQLIEKIIGSGGSVVSEYAPAVPALRYHFPRRNRIISGLSSGVLLIEGGERSGALITLKHASRQGRVRFALPGSIYQANSVAPNRLLRDGALAVTSADDILEHFGWPKRQVKPPAAAARVVLDDNGKRLVEMLKIESLSFDELAQRTGLATPSLNSLLTILQMRGIIEQLPGKMYRAGL